MDDIRYTLHRRARWALNTLTPEERDAVRARVARLVELPELQWPALGAKRLASAEPLYIVPVDDSLRILVRAAAGEPLELEDIVRHETLQAFAPRK